ncbi:MAG TPA: methyltransferase, partial [Tepidisphaeraceae bacterium]|nr:methyltransferase [Tepidisphaeraceae bacterium]
GEFVLQICRKHPQVQATVLDLPVVCRVGREHVQGHPEGSRIRFMEGDAFTGPLPAHCDLISFKSMLHDWPNAHAQRLLDNATAALAPGGTLLIFERSRIDLSQTGLPWSLVPMLLFFRSFRPESFYEGYLRQLGYQDVKPIQIRLETPFILVTARKPK